MCIRDRAAIADASVDEARLQISNSPTNGYFLSAQSGNTGGLTWAQVTTDLVGDTSPQLGGTLDTNGNLISFPDSGGVNSNRLKIGSGNDIEIFHVSNNSYFDFPTGYNTYFRTGTNRDNAILIKPDNAVELYYDNSKKLETTSSGVAATGNVTTTGHFYGPDNSQLRLGSSDDLKLYHDGSDSIIKGTGTGSLILESAVTNEHLQVKAGVNGDFRAYVHNGTLALICNAATQNAELRCGGATRFETTSTGASLTGSLNANGHVVPNANNSWDLGTTSARWRNVYTNDLHLSNEGSSNDVDSTWGDWTIQEGESDLFLKNNRSGKKYKFNLTEVS